jgi:hypothetical protein
MSRAEVIEKLRMHQAELRAERFYQHLKSKREGDVVTAVDLMAATDWSLVTLKTHVNKNALAPFLTPINGLNPIQNTKFRVRRDGAEIC